MNDAKPQILLGFDFGTKSIGVAVGQTLTKTARPLIALSAASGEPNWDEVIAVIQEWHPQALVVGIPLNMDGTEQELTKLARKFAVKLHKKSNLPVYLVDERLTTVAARERLFATPKGYRALEKASIDAMAAKLILETWMLNLNIEE